MLPRTDASSTDSENDDAPEFIPLFQSKKNIQRLEAEQRNAQVAQGKAKRDKNRELDRKLKERAVRNKRGKEGAVDDAERKKKRQKLDKKSLKESRPSDAGKSRERDELEKRMQRALQEAEEEEDLESYGEEFMGINIGQDEDADEDDGPSNSSGSDSDEDEATVPRPDHLPDELFAAAFRSSSKRKIIEDDKSPKRAEKKRKKLSSKKKQDILVGSRAIRILPNASAPRVPSTTPSQKINRFLNRTLALKNGKQNLRTRGWERRPVNIGLLKRDGPALSFVRDK